MALLAKLLALHGQKLVVRQTFWEVDEGCETPGQPRSKSAPPGLSREVPRQISSRTPAKPRKKRSRRSDEETALAEFAARARQERWGHVATLLLAAAARRLVIAVRVRRLQLRRAATEPQLRLRLPQHVFAEAAALLFASTEDAALLVRIGVLRPNGDAVEMWCADAPLADPVMQSILRTLERVLALWSDGCIQLVVDGCRPIVMRYTDRFTFEAMHVALLAQGFQESAYKLYWQHRELSTARGLLKDVGIGAGASIVIHQEGIVQI
jgi:hypothetical protein